ncbi:unnamed protein product [Plasmodium vivax]|uniref:(malaria parasite P. vivax) hypothetical protein n=1 Tax=Plasmodium vivax TaxID=5855 RepID=A0A8S4HGL7_PLAVI|nr:unnamed protein product [Plasmodium vivax]
MNTDLTTREAKTAEEKSPLGRLTFSELAQLSDYLKPSRNNEMSLLEGKPELPAQDESYMNRSAKKNFLLENYELASQNARNSAKKKKNSVCSDKSCVADSCIEQPEQSYNPFRNKLIDEEENNHLKPAKWHMSHGHDSIQGKENLPNCESHVNSSLIGEQNVLTRNDEDAHNNLSSNSTRIDSSDVFFPTKENGNSVKKECASYSPSISNSRKCECDENGKAGQWGGGKAGPNADTPFGRGISGISGLSFSGGSALGKECEEVGEEEGGEEREEEEKQAECEKSEDEESEEERSEEERSEEERSEEEKCEDDQIDDDQSGDERSDDEQSDGDQLDEDQHDEDQRDGDQRTDEEADMPIDPTTAKEKRPSQGSRRKDNRAIYTKREEQTATEKKSMPKEKTNKYKDNLSLFNELLKHKGELSYFHQKMVEDEQQDELPDKRQEQRQANRLLRDVRVKNDGHFDERARSSNVVKLRQNGNAHLWNSSRSNAGAFSGKHDIAQVGVRSNNSTCSALAVGKNASFVGGPPASESNEGNGDDMNGTSGSIELSGSPDPRDGSNRSTCSCDHLPSKGTHRDQFNGAEKESNEKKSLQKKRHPNLYSYLLLENKKEQTQNVQMKINVKFKNIYLVKYKHVKCVVTNNSGVIVHSFSFCKNGADLEAQNRIFKMYNKDKESFHMLRHDEVQVLLEELKRRAHTDVTFELLFDAHVVNGRVEISPSTFYRLSFYGVEEVPQKGVEPDAKGTKSRETSARLTKEDVSAPGGGISGVVAKGGAAKGKTPRGEVAQGKVAHGKVTIGKAANGKVAQGGPTNGKTAHANAAHGKVTNRVTSNRFSTNRATNHRAATNLAANHRFSAKGATGQSGKSSATPVTKPKEEKEKNSYIGFTILHLKYLFQMQEKGSVHLNISSNNNEGLDFVKSYSKEEHAHQTDGKALAEMYSNNLSYVDKIGMLFKILFGHSLNISSQKVFLEYQFVSNDVSGWDLRVEGDSPDRHADFKSALEMVQKGNVSNQLETKKGVEECMKNYLKNCSHYIYDEITISLFGLPERNGEESDKRCSVDEVKGRGTCGRPRFCKSPSEATIQGSFSKGGPFPYTVCSVASREGTPYREASKLSNSGWDHHEEEVKTSIRLISEACLPDSCEASQRLKPHLVNLLNWLERTNEKRNKKNKKNKKNKRMETLEHIIRKYTTGFNDCLDFAEVSNGSKAYKLYEENKKLKEYIKNCNCFFINTLMRNHQEIQKLRHSNKTVNILYNRERMGNLGRGGVKGGPSLAGAHSGEVRHADEMRHVGHIDELHTPVELDRFGAINTLEQQNDILSGMIGRRPVGNLAGSASTARRGERGCPPVCPHVTRQDSQSGNYHVGSKVGKPFSKRNFQTPTADGGRADKRTDLLHCTSHWPKEGGAPLQDLQGRNACSKSSPQLSSFSAFRFGGSGGSGRSGRGGRACSHSCHLGRGESRGGPADISGRRDRSDGRCGSGRSERSRLLTLYSNPIGAALHARAPRKERRDATTGSLVKSSKDACLLANAKWSAWRRRTVGGQGSRDGHVRLEAPSSSHEMKPRQSLSMLKKKGGTTVCSGEAIHAGGIARGKKGATTRGECSPWEARPELKRERREREGSTTSCRSKRGPRDPPEGGANPGRDNPGGDNFGASNPKGDLPSRAKNNYDTSEVLKKEYFHKAQMGPGKKGQTLPNYWLNPRGAKEKGKEHPTEGATNNSSEDKSGEWKVTHVGGRENASVSTLRGGKSGAITGGGSTQVGPTQVGRISNHLHGGRKGTNTVVTAGGANKENHMNNVDYKKRYIERVISTYDEYIPIKREQPHEGRKICTISGSASRVQSPGVGKNDVANVEGVGTKESPPNDNAITSIKEIIQNNLTRKSNLDLSCIEKSALLKNLHNGKVPPSVYLEGVKSGGQETHPKAAPGGEKRRAPNSKDAYILDIIDKNLNKSFSQLDRIKKKMSEHLVV